MELIKLAENLGIDVDDFKELFELYMETTSSDLEALKTAISARDAEEIDRKAHSIKGSSGNLGFNGIYELAKEIDNRARENALDGLDVMVQELSEEYVKLVAEYEKVN